MLFASKSASRPKNALALRPSEKFFLEFCRGKNFWGLLKAKANAATRHRLERQSPRWHPPGPTNERLATRTFSRPDFEKQFFETRQVAGGSLQRFGSLGRYTRRATTGGICFKENTE